MADKVAASQESNEGVTEDGIEDAFEVCGYGYMDVSCLEFFFLF